MQSLVSIEQQSPRRPCDIIQQTGGHEGYQDINMLQKFQRHLDTLCINKKAFQQDAYRLCLNKDEQSNHEANCEQNY